MVGPYASTDFLWLHDEPDGPKMDDDEDVPTGWRPLLIWNFGEPVGPRIGDEDDPLDGPMVEEGAEALSVDGPYTVFSTISALVQ